MILFTDRRRGNVKILKRLKYISHYELWMFAVVSIAAVLRFVLIYSNWPITDADEGNMGVLALHVAFQGTILVSSMAGPTWDLWRATLPPRSSVFLGHRFSHYVCP